MRPRDKLRGKILIAMTIIILLIGVVGYLSSARADICTKQFNTIEWRMHQGELYCHVGKYKKVK